MKIVVRMPNWVGDAVMALPVPAALKARFPEAGIWVAAEEWVAGLFSPALGIDGVVTIPHIHGLKSLSETGALLKAHRFDIGVLLTNSFSSALAFKLGGIPERWGFSRDGRGFLLTRRVYSRSISPGRHQADIYLDLLAGLGIDGLRPPLDLRLTEKEAAEAETAMAAAGRDPARPLVVFHPGASFGPAKRWPAGLFAEAGRLFEEREGADILVVGSAEDGAAAAVIADRLERKALDFTGKTSLRLLTGIIRAASLFVTNDTGPMHIAAALKTPTVAVFGPTDPEKTGPRGGRTVILKKEVPCWPCRHRVCPRNHECMTLILPEEVYAAGRRLL